MSLDRACEFINAGAFQRLIHATAATIVTVLTIADLILAIWIDNKVGHRLIPLKFEGPQTEMNDAIHELDSRLNIYIDRM